MRCVKKRNMKKLIEAKIEKKEQVFPEVIKALSEITDITDGQSIIP